MCLSVQLCRGTTVSTGQVVGIGYGVLISLVWCWCCGVGVGFGGVGVGVGGVRCVHQQLLLSRLFSVPWLLCPESSDFHHF